MFGAPAARAGAAEIWIAPTYQADLGGLGVNSNVVWPVTPVGAVRFSMSVPGDLQTFQAAKLVLIPAAPGGAAVAHVIVCRAHSSTLVSAQCGGAVDVNFTGVTNRLSEVDISGAIAPMVSGAGTDYLAILAYTTPTTGTDHIVGMRFSYASAAPAGAATLGANTFTGAQTAPAFVGSGAGLTNLPIPPGVATLGANTFAGSQTVNGDVIVSGNIAAKYQDVAEWVETASPLEAGTVVIVDPRQPNRVLQASRAYDTRVAGAVSKQPGLVLGEGSATKAMVAQSGRVRVKADARYGAIRIGDLLVTSPTTGHAMRSRPLRVGDQTVHRSGTLLGKALEPLAKGQGEILVLLTLQ
jgi:hypothetical protein